MKKTNPLFASLALAVTSLQPVEAQPVNITQVDYAVRYMADKRNEHDFVVIDKKNARVLLVEDSKIIASMPVLLGPVGDGDYVRYNTMTPAGVFNTLTAKDHKAYKDYTFNTVIHFNCNVEQTACTSIHAVWRHSPAEKRMQRLNTVSVADNRMTNGCVNLYDADFLTVEKFMQEKRNSKGRQPQVIILPENPDIKATAAFFARWDAMYQ